jgi:hypothetical protein
VPGYRYAEEFAALCDADCIAAVRRSGYAPGGYADVRDGTEHNPKKWAAVFGKDHAETKS